MFSCTIEKLLTVISFKIFFVMGIYLSLIILGNAFFSDHFHVFGICLSKQKIFQVSIIYSIWYCVDSIIRCI